MQSWSFRGRATNCVQSLVHGCQVPELKKILDASWGATRGSIAYGIKIDAQPCSNPFVLFGPTPALISPTAIFNDLLFKVAVRSAWLCILVAGL